jgi:hypothetical protein
MPVAIPEAIASTHADRPRPKRQLPLRVVKLMVGGKDMNQLEYRFPHPVGNGKSVELTQHLLIQEPDPRLVIPPLHILGYYTFEIMGLYWDKEAEVDGLLAKIDTLTTDVLFRDREIESLQAKLAEMTRQRDQAKQHNGKRG